MFFNTQLDVWERESGERPIQLALEGTSPATLMEDLAEDTDFTGTLIVGIAPGLAFSGYESRRDAFKRYQPASPKQWMGQQISMLVEPYLAFYHFDYSLFTVVKRQDWPERADVFSPRDVRRLATYGLDRNARMYAKVEVEESYANIAKDIWAQGFKTIDEMTEEEVKGQREDRDKQFERFIGATQKLQDRAVCRLNYRYAGRKRLQHEDPFRLGVIRRHRKNVDAAQTALSTAT